MATPMFSQRKQARVGGGSGARANAYGGRMLGASGIIGWARYDRCDDCGSPATVACQSVKIKDTSTNARKFAGGDPAFRPLKKPHPGRPLRVRKGLKRDG